MTSIKALNKEIMARLVATEKEARTLKAELEREKKELEYSRKEVETLMRIDNSPDYKFRYTRQGVFNICSIQE
jgi:hypothetical protein